MKVGTVLFWERCVHVKGQLKARWFVYLGKTAYGVDPPRAHIATTTTQLLHYADGGYRSQHLTMRFSRGEFGFNEDCILDVDADVQSTFLSRLDSGQDITVKGYLDARRLEQLHVLIQGSRNIDKITKQEIAVCFRDAGVRSRRS